MKHIIVGTDRPNSRSLQVAQAVHQIYQQMGEACELIDLREISHSELDGTQYQSEKPAAIAESVSKIESSEGLIFVVPEYNGSFPGALKYFIDHWSFPDAFEYRPTCFIGLGWQWGGLRPIEHLQQVMGYRNAYVFPKRVFMQNIGQVIDENGVVEEKMAERLASQAKDFCRFSKALKEAKLDANSVLEAKKEES